MLFSYWIWIGFKKHAQKKISPGLKVKWSSSYLVSQPSSCCFFSLNTLRHSPNQASVPRGTDWRGKIVKKESLDALKKELSWSGIQLDAEPLTLLTSFTLELIMKKKEKGHKNRVVNVTSIGKYFLLISILWREFSNVFVFFEIKWVFMHWFL